MIRLMKNTFYNETEEKKKLIDFILNEDRLSMGPKCKEFEDSFADKQGRKYSVFVNSGSSANLVLIQALLNKGVLKKGDTVGFSSLTWSTNVMPLIQLGLKVIPIDVSKKNLNVTTENLLDSIGNIKALFLTNLLGLCGDLPQIKTLCKERGVILLEDTCESLGSEIGGEKFGNFGLASTFSFFVGHHISTIEGGMVCTDDEELYEMLLMTRAHGWARNLNEETKTALKIRNDIEDFYDCYTFYTTGFNLRPTEIAGFIGAGQVKYWDVICKKREENFKRYDAIAKTNKDLIPLGVSHIDFVSNFAYPVLVKDKSKLEEYKKKFAEKLEIRPIVGGSITKQPFFNEGDYSCPNAEEIHAHGFYIPNNPDLTGEEVNEICNLLK